MASTIISTAICGNCLHWRPMFSDGGKPLDTRGWCCLPKIPGGHCATRDSRPADAGGHCPKHEPRG
jgi:hypothetical protein